MNWLSESHIHWGVRPLVTVLIYWSVHSCCNRDVAKFCWHEKVVQFPSCVAGPFWCTARIVFFFFVVKAWRQRGHVTVFACFMYSRVSRRSQVTETTALIRTVDTRWTQPNLLSISLRLPSIDASGDPRQDTSEFEVLRFTERLIMPSTRCSANLLNN